MSRRSFLYGSRLAQQSAVVVVLTLDTVPRPNRDYVHSLPGWSGIVSLGLFWVLAALACHSSENEAAKFSNLDTY